MLTWEKRYEKTFKFERLDKYSYLSDFDFYIDKHIICIVLCGVISNSTGFHHKKGENKF